MIAVGDETLGLGLPAAAIALVWMTLWRRPFRRIGNAWDARQSQGTSMVIMMGVTAFWLACAMFQLGLRDALSERSAFADASSLQGARRTRFVEIERFEMDRAACVWAWYTAYPSRGHLVSVYREVACPISPDGRAVWLAWSWRENFDRALLRNPADRAAIYREVDYRTGVELSGLPPRIKYFERIVGSALGRDLARALPASAMMLLAHTKPRPDGAGWLIASGVIAAILLGGLLVVPIQRPLVAPPPT
jgi:hypothetical protein